MLEDDITFKGTVNEVNFHPVTSHTIVIYRFSKALVLFKGFGDVIDK